MKVDVDQCPDLSAAYKISAMPTLMVVKGQWNNVVQTIVGGGQANVDKIFGMAQGAKWFVKSSKLRKNK